MECVKEGDGMIERLSMNYPIYFFVRAEKQKDGDSAALAVEEAVSHMKDFLAWLRDKRNKEIEEGNRDGDDHNNSWNCGWEGESTDIGTNFLRHKQIKNFISILI